MNIPRVFGKFRGGPEGGEAARVTPQGNWADTQRYSNISRDVVGFIRKFYPKSRIFFKFLLDIEILPGLN